MIQEEQTNKITKLLIESTENCLVDPYRVMYVISKSYPIRDKFVGWNRILDIVCRSLQKLDFNAISLELYYDKEETN